jgi:hypothetical protein
VKKISPVEQCLVAIAKAHNGILKAEDVVDAARPVNSPLHASFCWDDTKAAEQWRLHQARNLIRVVVTILPVENTLQEVDVYCSLDRDRRLPGGGYRTLVSVLNDKQLRAELLKEACRDMQIFTQKYAQLTQLVAVRAAMRKALQRLTAKKKAKKTP